MFSEALSAWASESCGQTIASSPPDCDAVSPAVTQASVG